MTKLIIEMSEIGHAQSTLECVLNQIKEGYNSGIDPTWYFESENNCDYGYDIIAEKKGENFEYICPQCGFIHTITEENYSYNMFKNGQAVQETCDNCCSTLFINEIIGI